MVRAGSLPLKTRLCNFFSLRLSALSKIVKINWVPYVYISCGYVNYSVTTDSMYDVRK